MATNKDGIKKNLEKGLDPLLDSFRDSLSSSLPNGLSQDNEPLTITFVLNQKGVKKQGSLKFGRDKDGNCGWQKPKDYVGPCL